MPGPGPSQAEHLSEADLFHIESTQNILLHIQSPVCLALSCTVLQPGMGNPCLQNRKDKN